ncbi:glycosyl hydrolase [Allopusillimonas ginsengisoli]|nr:glycosyl hydrolase [Allopusillimonas ginsengisoli]
MTVAGFDVVAKGNEPSIVDTQVIALASPASIALTHVHGLAYSADGKQILIPSHHGIAAYASGRWSKMAGPVHDYMGFAATRYAFYSSGHPAAGSNLINPFGLIKSTDAGETWLQLGLEGESDFHTLAASYETSAVYVLNYSPNTRMPRPGLYITQTDGMIWTQAAANGLKTKINALAVHPSNASVIAVGAADGLFISRDAGNDFEQLLGGTQVLAQWFDLDGEHLWVSSYANAAALSRISLKDKADIKEITLPPLNEDAVAFIAQNPTRHDELAIATFKRSVYVTEDSGETWTKIADGGTTRNK